jgi:hypothetical protein
MNQIPVLLQEGTVMSPPRDTLRATEVQVNSIAVRRNVARRLKKVIRIIRAKLHKQWPINRGASV